jgi:hypothetical protein
MEQDGWVNGFFCGEIFDLVTAGCACGYDCR